MTHDWLSINRFKNFNWICLICGQVSVPPLSLEMEYFVEIEELIILTADCKSG